MALEPNIALQAGAGAAAPPNPLQQFQQVTGIANAVAQNKLMGQALETQQQALAATRLKALGGIAATALSQFDPNNPDSLVHALHLGIDGAVKNGAIDQGTAQHLFEGIAKTGSPDELVGRVKQFALLAVDPNAALGRVFGVNGTQNLGGTNVSGVYRDPMFGGGFNPVTGLPMTLTPGEKAGEVPTVAPSGQPGTVPRSTRVDEYGNPRAPAAPPINPRYNGGQAAPPAAPAAPTANAPPAFNPTGPQPDFAANQDAYLKAQQDIPQGQIRVQNLDEAHKALELINSGRSTATIQKMREFMQTRGLLPAGLDKETVDYAVAKKYLIDYARRQSPRTDSDLQTALDANASTDIPNPAALKIVRMNIGRERLAMAATQAHPDTSGAGFIRHQAEYVSKYDPRAFAADKYTPEELKAIEAEVKNNPQARKRFFDGLAEAARRKMLNVP